MLFAPGKEGELAEALEELEAQRREKERERARWDQAGGRAAAPLAPVAETNPSLRVQVRVVVTF